MRRVKCDEAKPFCHRCVSTGRKCSGFREAKPLPAGGVSLVSWQVDPRPLLPGAQDANEDVTQAPHLRQSLSTKPTTHHLEIVQQSSSYQAPSATVGAAPEVLKLNATETPTTSRPHGPPVQPLASAQDLVAMLGELKVDDVGRAPYLRSEHLDAVDGHEKTQDPQMSDDEMSRALQRLKPILDRKVQIPEYFLPRDDEALRYFDLYFKHAHPYVPVIDIVDFYEQWRTDRAAISPLILEAMLAIGAQVAGEMDLCCQWLLLFSKSVESCMGTQSLGNLQGLLIGLKAHEAAPQPGYFGHSWKTVTDCVRIGKAIGLSEHFENHKYPFACRLDPTTCWLHRRIWQTVFVCETMIGTPQGRRDLSVDLESVDFGVPDPVDDTDRTEQLVTRQFACLARLVCNIRRTNVIYLKRQKEPAWGKHPEYLGLEHSMSRFAFELPSDLACELPLDGTRPYPGSAFVGNLHSYYYLSLILYHRGVLGFLDPLGDEKQWNYHMSICYDSAKSLCRLQEAIVASYGLVGLQSMQRGFSFSVYACLSCVLIHLVAILSPDPDLSTESCLFLERHIHLAERIMTMWHMPDVRKQLDAFKTAFSANSQSQPFTLRQTFMDQRRTCCGPERPQVGAEGSMAAVMTTGEHVAGLAADVAPTWDPVRIAEQWQSLSAAPDPLDFTSMFQR